MQESESESTASGVGYGASSIESFASYDLESCSWKTRQVCLFGGWIEFSGTWPRAGTMRNGKAFQQFPLVPNTSGIGFGLQPIPTPTVNDSRGGRNATARRTTDGNHHSGMTLVDYVTIYPTPRADARDNAGGSNSRRTAKQAGVYIGRKLNPEFVEYLMGLPIGWTALEDSGMPASHKLSNGSDETS